MAIAGKFGGKKFGELIDTFSQKVASNCNKI